MQYTIAIILAALCGCQSLDPERVPDASQEAAHGLQRDPAAFAVPLETAADPGMRVGRFVLDHEALLVAGCVQHADAVQHRLELHQMGVDGPILVASSPWAMAAESCLLSSHSAREQAVVLELGATYELHVVQEYPDGAPDAVVVVR